jgi:hypothetical protein
MKKFLISFIAFLVLLSTSVCANAHGWRGGYGGGWRGGWAPFAAGAVVGAVVAHGYYRPAPIYYGPPAYYYPPQNVAAFCPENGLYYPQTQACPSGWQRVITN